MKERLPLLIAFILVLAVVAVYLNMDFIRSDYRYPDAITQRLAWQGEPEQRSFELREGLDLQGGLQLLLEADMRDAAASDLDQAANIIKNRVDTLGVVEPLVQTQGSDKIVVELPGVTDPDLAVRTVGKTALLEFIYSGQDFLEEGSSVQTSWGVERKLFDELPEEKQQPYSDELVETEGDDAEAEAAGANAEDTSEEAEAADADSEAGEEEAEAGDEAATGEEGAEAGEDVAAGDEAATGEEGATGEEEGAEAGEDVAAGEQITDTEEVGEIQPTEEISPTESVETAAPGTIYPTVLTGDSLKTAVTSLDQLNKIAVSFQLDAAGGEKMQKFTRDHQSTQAANEVMPIVLDGEVISSPRVQSEIGAQGQIQGNFSQAEADVLVAQLRSGALPVALKTVGQTRIGPTLGSFAVESAIRGGVVGFIAVMVFMLVYYRFPGLLADVALVLYALLVLSLFRVIPVTLTLAGIAGFVLSIGMAVDANILIFERMKEELRAGRRIGAAMDTGFARAWPSIRDSNLSTLITCAILFWFGSQFGASIVKGFAITLALGVLTSLFTAITVTRSLLSVSNRLVLREEEGVEAMESPRLKALFGF